MSAAGIKNKKKEQLIEHREEQILAAAKAIFAQKSFCRTKVDDIADELKVGKGTIYRYFQDKKSLFLAVFNHGMSELKKAFWENVEPVSNPRLKFAAAVRTYFDFFDNNRELVEIDMQVRSEFKEEYRQAHMEMYDEYIVKIQNNIRNGIKMGIFRDVDVEKTAEAISATLHGVLQGFYIREFEQHISVQTKRETLMDRAQAVISLLLDGLSQKNSERKQ